MVRANGLAVDQDELLVHAKEKTVRLTRTECLILTALIESHGRTLSRCQLLQAINGYHDDTSIRTVDTHIKNIRKKIGPRRIESLYGLGYRFQKEE